MRRNTDEDLNALRRRAEQHDLTAIEALSNAARRVGDVELAREAARLAGEVLDALPRSTRSRKKVVDYSVIDEAQRVSDATLMTFKELWDDQQWAGKQGVYSGPDPLSGLAFGPNQRFDRFDFAIYARAAVREGVIARELVPAAAWYYENVRDDMIGRDFHPALGALGRSRRALELAIAKKTLIDDEKWEVYLPINEGVSSDRGRARFFYGMKRGQVAVDVDLVDPTPVPGAGGGTIVDSTGPYFVAEDDYREEPFDLDELPVDIRCAIAFMAYKVLRERRDGLTPPVAMNPDEDLQGLLRQVTTSRGDKTAWERLLLSVRRAGRFVRGRLAERRRAGALGDVWTDEATGRWGVYFHPDVDRTPSGTVGSTAPMWTVDPGAITELWLEDSEDPARSNPDDDLQALLRQVATEDDNDALIERLVREARRRGRGDLVNAAMSHANYPTWNRLAPDAYAGAAAWPEADLREGARVANEMLDRAAYDDPGFVVTKRDHLWPVLEVLVGNRQPVRWVTEPGVHRKPASQATADVSSVVRAWVVQRIPNVAREPRGMMLVGVLDKEAGAITLANEHADGHGHDPIAMRWLGEILPARGGSWQHWARNTEAFDRVRLPVDLARQWLAEARRTWGVRPGPTEHFLDLVRYAGEASARHEFPAGWRTGDMVFDENAQHTGYFVQEDGWERGDGVRAVWSLDEQRTPAAVAWSWVLNDEAARRGFAHVTPGSEFDPDNWIRRGAPRPDRHRRQEVARRRCVHCGIEGARVLSPQGAFCDPCWQALGGIMGGAP